MIDHTGIKVSDLASSRAFYGAAAGPLGYPLEFGAAVTGAHGVAGFGAPPRADFWLAAGEPNFPPLHVAFRTGRRALVDRFHAAALTRGGPDTGAPGPRAHDHADYHGAFVPDPDGHNIEVPCREHP